MRSDLQERIFALHDLADFREMAIEVFRNQYQNNTVYNEFITGLRREPELVRLPEDIPFLPVEFFRNRKIVCGNDPVEIIFKSSSTSGSVPGSHFVSDLSLYEKSFTAAFRLFYGEPSEYLIAALLPSYTEREGSSLVYMAEKLIGMSRNPLSGFFRDNIPALMNAIHKGKAENQKVLLLGVSFALLDLAEMNTPPDLSGVIVMETGGMKGRRKEITRQELHSVLTSGFNVSSIHSEYGMTELLSQAYSKGDGRFLCPPWMKVLIRDPQDPLTIFTETGRTGGINIIDLANINSCSFLATSDLGRLHDDGSFEVLGRFDNSDVRGCNLMAE
jgi:phenylacetate-coenzyme A ligase PaaK-like adenylate-forming protein